MIDCLQERTDAEARHTGSEVQEEAHPIQEAWLELRVWLLLVSVLSGHSTMPCSTVWHKHCTSEAR